MNTKEEEIFEVGRVAALGFAWARATLDTVMHNNAVDDHMRAQIMKMVEKYQNTPFLELQALARAEMASGEK